MIRKPTNLERPPRRDSNITSKAQLLEAAGEVFADKGFFAATGKEITECAGCNPAAINYHFGGMENLYGEVLIEAHHRLVSYEELVDLAHDAGDAAQKLTALAARLVDLGFAPGPASWPLRVLGREMLSSTRFFTTLIERAIVPKKRIALQLIAEYLGTAPENPVAGLALMTFMAPYLMLLVGNRQLFRELAPDFFNTPDQSKILAHFLTISFGGLAAIKAGLEGR